jgi:hypothetical protein
VPDGVLFVSVVEVWALKNFFKCKFLVSGLSVEINSVALTSEPAAACYELKKQLSLLI